MKDYELFLIKEAAGAARLLRVPGEMADPILRRLATRAALQPNPYRGARIAAGMKGFGPPGAPERPLADVMGLQPKIRSAILEGGARSDKDIIRGAGL